MDNFDLERRLKVVAIYPDGLTRSRIMAVLNRIQDKLWPRTELEICWARFDHFADPLLRSAVAPKMASSEGICFVIRKNVVVPPELKQWLMALDLPDASARPLIALLEMSEGSTTNESEDVRIFFQELARQHRMTFLPYYTGDLSNSNPDGHTKFRLMPSSSLLDRRSFSSPPSS